MDSPNILMLVVSSFSVGVSKPQESGFAIALI